MSKNIGFIGLGIMGKPMAKNLAKAGYNVTIYNRTKPKPEDYPGLKIAAHPAELSKACDVVIMMLTGPEAIGSLLWGPDGAGKDLGPGKVLVNMSTVSPAYTARLSSEVEEGGAVFIDAPVSGSKKPAEDASLVILAGGPKETVDELEPVFLGMGKKVVYCGQAPMGSMMKMSINLLLGSMMEGLCEMLNFGRKGGLSVETMLDVVLSGPMSCGLFKLKEGMLREGEYPPQFPLRHMSKDLKFVADTAYDLKACVPSVHSLQQLFSAAMAKGHGDEDFAAVMKVLELLS